MKCIHCEKEIIDDGDGYDFLKENGCYFHDYCYGAYVHLYGKQTPEGLIYFIPDEEERLREGTGYKVIDELSTGHWLVNKLTDTVKQLREDKEEEE